MTTLETKSFPLLEDEGLSYAQNTNRIAALLYADVEYPRGECPRSCWTYDPMQSACMPELPALEKMLSAYMASIVRLLQAKANDDVTRPLVLFEPWVRPDDIQHGLLPAQVHAHATQPLGILQPLPAEVEQPLQPEFAWSKMLYRARKAAQEYSQETHADH